MQKTLITLASLIAISTPAWAAMQTVKLSLPTMDCPVCPITVKKALTRVPGVSQAAVDFDKRQATVSFDNAKTSTGALTKATTDAGYPSTVIK